MVCLHHQEKKGYSVHVTHQSHTLLWVYRWSVQEREGPCGEWGNMMACVTHQSHTLLWVYLSVFAGRTRLSCERGNIIVGVYLHHQEKEGPRGEHINILVCVTHENHTLVRRICNG